MATVSPQLRTIAQTAFEALNSGDLDAYLSVIAEDVEFTSMIAEMEGQTFRGHEGARDWWNTVRGSFQDVKWELLELRECDPGAVAQIRATGGARRRAGRPDGLAGGHLPRRQADLVAVLPQRAGGPRRAAR